jgi:beta-RFAP synthase
MIRVVTGSRLHFGLFHLPGPAEEHWADRHGQPRLPVRRYGGVGMMIEAPGVKLTAAPAATWSAEGPLAGRALAFARRYAESGPGMTYPCQIRIERCAPEHVGLGTGTQLGLAVARALSAVAHDGAVSATDLARRVDRGTRSALGIHGFAEGGFLVEAGQRAPDTIAPLVCRVAFPTDWRVLLVMPQSGPGLHGVAERQAFAALPATPDFCKNILCRLVLLGMLPALQEADLPAFGEALHDFNARVGEAFAPVQGGVYASRLVAEIVGFLRGLGIRGIGQSSWGPAVFAVLDEEEHAQRVADLVRQRFAHATAEVLVTRGRIHGGICAEC